MVLTFASQFINKRMAQDAKLFICLKFNRMVGVKVGTQEPFESKPVIVGLHIKSIVP